MLTKDGILVVLHDVLLDDTTNIAELSEFKDRKTEKTVEGVKMTGFFASDFTFAELRTSVRLRQRLEGRSTLYDGLFTIPSLEEVLQLAQKEEKERKEKKKVVEKKIDAAMATAAKATTEEKEKEEEERERAAATLGIYIELKHPEYHVKDLGFNMSKIFLDVLTRANVTVKGEGTVNDWEEPNVVLPIVIQCFDSTFLSQDLSLQTDLPLVQLVEEPERYTETEIAKIAEYAQGIGPYKEALLFGVNGSVERARERVQWAQERGLKVHPWTFRADRGVLSPFQGNSEEEETFFFCCLGVDGIFTEFPDQTRAIVDNIEKRELCEEFDCEAYKLG